MLFHYYPSQRSIATSNSALVSMSYHFLNFINDSSTVLLCLKIKNKKTEQIAEQERDAAACFYQNVRLYNAYFTLLGTIRHLYDKQQSLCVILYYYIMIRVTRRSVGSNVNNPTPRRVIIIRRIFDLYLLHDRIVSGPPRVFRDGRPSSVPSDRTTRGVEKYTRVAGKAKIRISDRTVEQMRLAAGKKIARTLSRDLSP